MKVLFNIQCFDRPNMYYVGDTYEVSEETVEHFKKIGILGGKNPKAEIVGDIEREKPKASILEPPVVKPAGKK